MGKHFGNLQKLKGVTYYTVSPLELKPFAKMFNPGLQNAIRRFIRGATPAVLPLTLWYLVYDWAKKEHALSKRKVLEDFKDDK